MMPAGGALYDTGSRNSYAVPDSIRGLPVVALPEPFRVSLGGKKHSLHKQVAINAHIEKKPVIFNAFVIESIGKDEDGKDIQILFGALDMQRWGIRPVPDKEKLDLKHYSREFVEF